jgi:hypothetical protein
MRATFGRHDRFIQKYVFINAGPISSILKLTRAVPHPLILQADEPLMFLFQHLSTAGFHRCIIYENTASHQSLYGNVKLTTDSMASLTMVSQTDILRFLKDSFQEKTPLAALCTVNPLFALPVIAADSREVFGVPTDATALDGFRLMVHSLMAVYQERACDPCCAGG